MADIPTHSDILAYGNLIQERSETSMNSSDVAQEISSKIILIYRKVGTNLPIADEDSVRIRVSRYLKSYNELKRNHLKKKLSKCLWKN